MHHHSISFDLSMSIRFQHYRFVCNVFHYCNLQFHYPSKFSSQDMIEQNENICVNEMWLLLVIQSMNDFFIFHYYWTLFCWFAHKSIIDYDIEGHLNIVTLHCYPMCLINVIVRCLYDEGFLFNNEFLLQVQRLELIFGSTLWEFSLVKYLSISVLFWLNNKNNPVYCITTNHHYDHHLFWLKYIFLANYICILRAIFHFI